MSDMDNFGDNFGQRRDAAFMEFLLAKNSLYRPLMDAVRAAEVYSEFDKHAAPLIGVQCHALFTALRKLDPELNSII